MSISYKFLPKNRSKKPTDSFRQNRHQQTLNPLALSLLSQYNQCPTHNLRYAYFLKASIFG